MEAVQEPLDNKGGKKKEEPIVIPSDSTVINPSATPVEKKETVKEINVKVDLTKKPEEIKEPINLLNHDEFLRKQTSPTEADLKQDKKQEEKVNEFKEKISSTSTPSSAKTTSPDKRQKQAEKWVKAIDIAVLWGLKAWSGQADDVGLKTNESDKQTLADALADVMEEYDFNPAPLLTLGITAVAVYGTPFTNAQDSRKKIRAFRKSEEAKKKKEEELNVKVKPEFDPATGQHKKRRGGQFKS